MLSFAAVGGATGAQRACSHSLLGWAGARCALFEIPHSLFVVCVRDRMPVAQLDSLLGARVRRAVHGPYQKENAGGRAREIRMPRPGPSGRRTPAASRLEQQQHEQRAP